MRAPRIPSIFKLNNNSHKQFQYQPRTFDEQKERLEKRRKEIERDVELENRTRGDLRTESRTRISDSWIRRETRRQQRNSSRRVLLILAALAILVYLIFSNTDFLT